MNPDLEETIYVDFITSLPTTGAASDADSTPTCEVFEDNTDTAILTPTVVKRTGKTGDYRVPIACTSANGFEAGKSYNVVASATVGGVVAKAIIQTFQMRSNSLDDLAASILTRSTYAGTDTAGTTTLLSRIASALTITAGKVDVNDKTGFALTAAYDPAKLAAPVGAAMTLTSAYDSAKVAASQTSVNGVKTSTDNLATAMELDGAVYRFTTNALEQAPVSGATDPWNTALPGSYTAGTAGSIVGTRLDVAVSTRATPGAAMSLTVDYNAAKTAATPDQVQAELVSYGAAKPGSEMALSPAYDAAKNAASQSSLDAVKAVVDAIKLIDDKLNTAMEPDGAVYRFTMNALEQAPTGSGGTGSVSPADRVAIADEVLKRDWTLISGEAVYSLLNAARMLRNVWNTNAGTLTVKKEDGSTNAWQRTLAVDPNAQPIVGAT